MADTRQGSFRTAFIIVIILTAISYYIQEATIRSLRQQLSQQQAKIAVPKSPAKTSWECTIGVAGKEEKR